MTVKVEVKQLTKIFGKRILKHRNYLKLTNLKPKFWKQLGQPLVLTKPTSK